jgi:hypothetical protein
MNTTSDSRRHGVTVVSPRLRPLAAAGVITVAAAVGAYLSWPSSRSSAPAQRRRSLVAYLREHLSGSDVAIHVVRRLASTQEAPQDQGLFHRLIVELEEDRETVRGLLRQLGASPRSPKRLVASVSGALLRGVAGGGRGDLSLLRTFEALSIGIQGKRCMWRTLQELGTTSSADRAGFVALEAKAVRQWEAVEDRRRSLANATFPRLESR